jgi:hypothetical protein
MYKILLTPLLVLLYFSAAAQDKHFLPGTYYTPSGEKMTGFIYIPKPDGAHLYFKSDENGDVKKIAIGDIKAVVMPLPQDSLVVVTEDNKDDKKYFAKFAFATPVMTFYYKIRLDFHPGNPDVALGAPVSKSRGTVLRKMIPMYLDDNTTHELT